MFTKAVLAMFWVRLGSLNALVESAGSWFWKQWLQTKMPSADSVGRWATNLPLSLACTELVVRLGHARWDIENYGFNELVNGWHADHVYKHDPDAIEAFYLAAFIAFNVFHAFLILNLKPELRKGKTERYWIRVFISEIYPNGLKNKPVRAP